MIRRFRIGIPSSASERLSDVTLICRAACELKLQEYESAVEDCEDVLAIDGQNVKALFRLAQAKIALKVNLLSLVHRTLQASLPKLAQPRCHK